MKLMIFPLSTFRKELTVLSICILLIVLFGYTAFSKILDWKSFILSLKLSPLVGMHATWLAYFLIAAELLIVLLLLTESSRRAGLAGAFFLLGIFTAYLLIMLVTESNLPCSCGGVLNWLGWKEHVMFNLVMMALSWTGIKNLKQLHIEKDKRN